MGNSAYLAKSISSQCLPPKHELNEVEEQVTEDVILEKYNSTVWLAHNDLTQGTLMRLRACTMMFILPKSAPRIETGKCVDKCPVFRKEHFA